MLTNKNCVTTARLLILTLALSAGLSACAPPGERVLLQGKKLADEGKFSEAVPKLEQATSQMPKYAPAWNYLGLAYQGAHQPEQAVRAYRTALSLDHRLAASRFNLGCVLLDQGNLPAAIDELKSYALLQPSSLPGWLKLGAAQLKARRLDDAERSYRTALELQAHQPEALNGMGLIQSQRRRWQEALNYFNAAAGQDPPYSPAVLNSGVISHQNFGARAAALKRYRQYIELNPRPAGAEAVETLVRQLESELAGTARPAKPAATNLVAQSGIKTNPVPTVAPSTKQSGPPPGFTPRTSVVASAPPKPAPQISTTATTSPPVTKAEVKSEKSEVRSSTAALPAGQTSSPSQISSLPTSAPAPLPRPPEPEVTKVQAELVVQPAQEVVTPPVPASPPKGADTAPATANTESSAPKSTSAPKKSFLSRLNPFSGRPKTAEETSPPKPATFPAASSTPAPRAASGPVEAVASPRYSYLAPAKPAPGNRTEADPAFRRGVKAQQSGDRPQAIADYQAALQSDPAFFNAYYNLGLAAMDTGNLGLSLAAYETALALNPDSADARYNFALSLKGAGYYQDAAEQLARIVSNAPEDARAHLALANLNAQQLRRNAVAREHYLRVLELSPRHPEAAKIRFWLAANP